MKKRVLATTYHCQANDSQYTKGRDLIIPQNSPEAFVLGLDSMG